MEATSVGTCPTCTKEYPIYAQETTWCHHCNWNMEDQSRYVFTEAPFSKLRRTMGRKLSEQLFLDLKNQEVIVPRMTFEKAMVYGFATLVLAGSFSVLLTIPLLFMNIHWFLASLISVPILMLFWAVIPKPKKLPKGVASRTEFPTLYKLAEDIADAMKTSRPVMLAINDDFNAYYNEYGFGRSKRKFISIGLPLVCQLSDDEIIAVLAHETSHGANGDVARGTYVYMALDALANWYFALSPRHINEGDAGVQGGILGTWFANLLGWTVSQIPLIAYNILLKLLFRQQQEAEYLADTLAAKVCGTSAMISALEKLEYHRGFYTAVEHAAFSNDKNVDVFNLAKEINSKPKSEHEKERIRRLQLQYGLSMDSTHPPTPYRIEYISRLSHLPQVRMSKDQSLELHRELASLRKQASKNLIEDYLNGT